MKYLKLYEQFCIQKRNSNNKVNENSQVKKGTITVKGRVVDISGVGKIDLTGIKSKTEPNKMMTDVLPLIKNWNLEFIEKNLCHFSGQYLYEYEGRIFVLVKIGNWIMPFYYSSKGTSGKKIDWHYVFGVDSKEYWIIKGAVDSSGDMIYDDFFIKYYKEAIDKLESVKMDLRKNLPLTDSEKGEIVKFLYSNKNKYPKSLDTIYLDFDVTSGQSSAGMEVNDNYYLVLNTNLNLIQSSIGVNNKSLPNKNSENTESAQTGETNKNNNISSDTLNSDNNNIDGVIENLEKFLLKLDVTTNKLNSDKLFVFYRNVIKTMFLSKFEKEIEPLTIHLKLLKNAANSRDNKKIAEALTKIKYVLQIDDNGVTPWISSNNVELYLSKSTPRKIGNLHEELITIMKDFSVIN
jgi:hypothetical protein